MTETLISAPAAPAVFDAEKIPRPAAKDGKDGKPAELSNAEMEALLLEKMTLGDEELKALALPVPRLERVLDREVV